MNENTTGIEYSRASRLDHMSPINKLETLNQISVTQNNTTVLGQRWQICKTLNGNVG